MALLPVGKAAPLARAALEELWTNTAIYLERSSAALREAWTVDAARVRALPRFKAEPAAGSLIAALALTAGPNTEMLDAHGPAATKNVYQTIVRCALAALRALQTT